MTSRLRHSPLRAAVTAFAATAAVAGGLVTVPALGGGSASGGYALAATGSTAPTATSPTPITSSGDGKLRLAQANLKSGLTGNQIAADMATIAAQKPDFITYNEVQGRNDVTLKPSGFDLWRTPGDYTGETAVAWNASEWSPVASGTFLISNIPDQKCRTARNWTTRYANWVTLQNALGQVVSVVATHFAPDTRCYADLTVPSVRRLGELTRSLAASGPVLVGGDLNTNYKNATDYPRAEMQAQELTPTYDVLGTAPPTGDYTNATIDYVLLHTVSQFVVQQHYTKELNSDHDLLVADTAFAGASAREFAPGLVTSSPSDPAAVFRNVVNVLDKTPSGASIHLASKSLAGTRMWRAIRRAHNRGVHVQVLTGTADPSRFIKRLGSMLGTNTGKKSFAVNRPRAWRRAGLPPATLLASVSGGTPAVRVDVNRVLVPESMRETMRARFMTTKTEYDAMFVKFFRGVGQRG